MKYEYENYCGFPLFIDTKKINYEAIWDFLNFNQNEKKVAKKIIDLYHSKLTEDPAGHYRTLQELQKAAGNEEVIETLIENLVLELHPHWSDLCREYKENSETTVLDYTFYSQHPQAAYRINALNLYYLEKGFSKENFGEFIEEDMFEPIPVSMKD